jgi:hypothetical protein
VHRCRPAPAGHLANTLCAYATMGREPGAGLMREVEGRAEALAGTFNTQEVLTLVWLSCHTGSGLDMMQQTVCGSHTLSHSKIVF